MITMTDLMPAAQPRPWMPAVTPAVGPTAMSSSTSARRSYRGIVLADLAAARHGTTVSNGAPVGIASRLEAAAFGVQLATETLSLHTPSTQQLVGKVAGTRLRLRTDGPPV